MGRRKKKHFNKAGLSGNHQRQTDKTDDGHSTEETTAHSIAIAADNNQDAQYNVSGDKQLCTNTQEKDDSETTGYILQTIPTHTPQGMSITQNIKGQNVQFGNTNVIVNATSEDVDEPEGACGGEDVAQVETLLNTRPVYESKNKAHSHNTLKQEFSYAQAAGTQHINAENVYMNLGSVPQDKSPVNSKRNEFQNFLTSVGHFSKGHYILIISKTDQVKNLDSISLVPWVAVFDFDPLSRESGLLSNVEETISTNRAFHILSWQDKCSIMDGSTNWIFMTGCSQRPDSRTETEFRKWKKQVKVQFSYQVQQLGKFQESYTKFTIVMFWPPDNGLVQHFSYLLNEIEEHMDCSIVVVNDGKAKSQVAISALNVLQDIHKENMTTIELNLQDACTCIASSLSASREMNPSEYQLPKSDSKGDVKITDQQAQLLKEELEVLYINNKTGIQYDHESLLVEEDNFLKGGTLPWAWWYHVGAGHVDAERDILNEIKEYIAQIHIDVCKSGCITLYHAPGSGGTTLAQRIIWDLKEKTPCAQAKHRTDSSPVGLAGKIQLLSDKTHLPILLLMDGEDEQRMHLLQSLLRDICLIILYVKRYPYSIQKQSQNTPRGTFWLKSYVSEKEANILGLKYERQCSRNKAKQEAVSQLIRDISCKKNHSVFEFGLAVHSYEYRGIESYVKGFLRLGGNQLDDKELMPWQTSLGIMALVHYYGQTTIPCHFFSRLLGNGKSNPIFQLKDFPEEMKELIVSETSEGRSNVVRISHYYVAKEILDHILTWPVVLNREPSRCICSKAKTKLEPFAIAFIKEAGITNNGNSQNMCKIMRRTFISRDNSAVGENETQANRSKKPKLSPILEDVGSRAPYTERFNILKQLTSSFPMEPQFLAHLGRLYSLCLPGEEENAEMCFKKALLICEQETHGMENEEISHGMKLTLRNIYHMYGNMLLLRVSKYTGKYLGDKPRLRTEESNFELEANTLLQSVKLASAFFEKCREITPPGCEESFGFISEIHVRLMFCDYVYKHSRFATIHDYVDRNETECSEFIKDCYVALSDLFIECFSVIEPEKMDNNVMNCQEWFTVLFNTKSPGHFFQRGETIQSRRMKIAILKMKYSNTKTYGVLESFDNASDINFVVKEYEKNFDEAGGQQYLSHRAMDIDYCEWLFAIRHTLFNEIYPLEKVLQHVQKWYDCLKTQNSRFYLFILKSLIGFGNGGQSGNTELMIESQRLKEELLKHSKYIAKPRYPREWLGTPTTSIRRLQPGRRFFNQIEGREIRYRSIAANLEIMKGTICGPNDKPAGGYIDLDLGKNNLVPVKVFFVPVRTDMRGSCYVGARVEFVVGFSMSHGYEAFNVRSISHERCDKCDKLVEIQSFEREVVCPRCNICCTRKEPFRKLNKSAENVKDTCP